VVSRCRFLNLYTCTAVHKGNEIIFSRRDPIGVPIVYCRLSQVSIERYTETYYCTQLHNIIM